MKMSSREIETRIVKDVQSEMIDKVNVLDKFTVNPLHYHSNF